MVKPAPKKMKRTAIYPGTFDPITGGHIDIIRRGAKLADRLVVGVARNAGKDPLFDTRARVRMVEREVADLRRENFNIEVMEFDNLLMDFAASQGASVILRGLRAVSDFEYEFQMAGMNSYLNQGIDTVFLMSGDRHQFVSSRFVKEIARLGGDVTHFVSAHVARELKRRFAAASGRRKVQPIVRD
ncbi:MAG: pantetheine-phosphate adenylyltransferase [Alphaproteobacteria bacterium]